MPSSQKRFHGTITRLKDILCQNINIVTAFKNIFKSVGFDGEFLSIDTCGTKMSKN